MSFMSRNKSRNNLQKFELTAGQLNEEPLSPTNNSSTFNESIHPGHSPQLAQLYDSENYSPRSSISIDPNSLPHSPSPQQINDKINQNNRHLHRHPQGESVEVLKDNYKGFHAMRTRLSIPPLQTPIKPRFKKKSSSLLGKLIYSKKDDDNYQSSNSHHGSIPDDGSFLHRHSKPSTGDDGGFLHRKSRVSQDSQDNSSHRPSISTQKHRIPSVSSRHNSASSTGNQTNTSANSPNSSGGGNSGYISDVSTINNNQRNTTGSIANIFDLNLNEMQGIVKSPTSKPADPENKSTKPSEPTDDFLLPSWTAPESWDVKNLTHVNDNTEYIDEIIDEDSQKPDRISSNLPQLFGLRASHLVSAEGKSNRIIRVFREDNTFTTILSSIETTTAELLNIVQRKFFLESTSNFQISLHLGNKVKVLEPFEKPLRIQDGLLILSGYDKDADNLKMVGREDLSSICKFVLELISLRNLTHDEEIELSKDYVDVNIAGLNLKNIPIIFHQHTYEIEKLNVAKNPSIYIPLDFIQSCNNLTAVNFSSNGASKFPINFLEAPKLTKLTLEKNFLDEIPLKISKLSCLTDLRLNSNQLTSLPKSFSLLVNLQSLNLSSNYFKIYPECISDLLNLKDLDLSYNDLSDLPESIGRLTKLIKLNLCTNKLSKSLPSFFANLKSLKRLDIRYNQIANVDVLGNLDELEVAYASKNYISTFSDQMKSLRLLHFDRNPITNLHFENTLDLLTILDLSRAKITSIPPAFISKIPNVEKFVLDKNHLVTLPDEIGSLAKLTVLSLYGNNLRTLPPTIANLSSLQFLDLHSNNLQLLPDEIWNLTSLTVLNLSSNILTSFPKPPLSLAKRISASFNAKQHLQSKQDSKDYDEIYSSLPSQPDQVNLVEESINGEKAASLADSLLSITLADNRLGDECFESISFLLGLKLLNLSYNELLDIPEGALRRLVDLVELFLSGNELTSLPGDDLESLSSLKVLFLNNNKFVTLPAEISKLEKLQHLDVGSNQLKYNIANWPYDWNWQWNKNLKSLNFSGNKRFEIKQSHQKNPETGDYLDSLLVLKNLTVLGLIDVTITTGSVPDQSRDLRVRTTGSEFNNIGYGVADSMGARENISSGDLFVQKFRGNENEVLYVTFDGKGSPKNHGHRILHIAKELFVPSFTQELDKIKTDDEIKHAIRKTFLNLNKEINGVLAAKKSNHFVPGNQMNSELAELNLLEDAKSGCSVSMIYIKNKKLYSANIGDIEMVLTRSNGEHIILATKHDPTNRVEFERIRASGGYVTSDGNLDGELGVSRGVGYFKYIPHTHSGPEILEMKVNANEDMIVIGSKGVWDHIPYELSVDILRQEKDDPMLAAQRIRDYAIAYGNLDKVTVSVLTLGEKKSRGRFGSNALSSKLGNNSDVFAKKRRDRTLAITGDSSLRRLDDEIEPPVGELALVFTDIKNSTWLWDTYPAPMRSAIKIHNSIMRRQLRIVGGYEVKTEGDAFMVSFPSPTSALLWCFNVQQALIVADWPSEILETDQCCEVTDINNNVIFRGLSVRMGIHWGSPVCEPDVITGRMDYFGPMVNRASRISATADGGQIAVSEDFLEELETLTKIQENIDEGKITLEEAYQGNVHIGEIIGKEIKAVEEIGVEYFYVGEKKLKGLETPERITLAYPEGLKLRMELFEKRMQMAGDEANSTRIVGALPVQSIYLLRTISLRLENICATLDAGGIVQGTFLNSCDTVHDQINGVFKDAELLGLFNHLVVRVENCITTLFLRQQLEKVNNNNGFIDFTMSKTSAEMMTELQELTTIFQQLKLQLPSQQNKKLE